MAMFLAMLLNVPHAVGWAVSYELLIVGTVHTIRMRPPLPMPMLSLSPSSPLGRGMRGAHVTADSPLGFLDMETAAEEWKVERSPSAARSLVPLPLPSSADSLPTHCPVHCPRDVQRV